MNGTPLFRCPHGSYHRLASEYFPLVPGIFCSPVEKCFPKILPSGVVPGPAFSLPSKAFLAPPSQPPCQSETHKNCQPCAGFAGLWKHREEQASACLGERARSLQ